ncbi:MAG TPA: FmdB family zinc ribbon protein [Streptosporangiaceae bacterium]
MPTYQYACTECGDQSEVVQRFSDDPLTVCGACGGRLRKVFSPVGIVFKGSGFYRTDSRAGSVSGGSSNGKSGEGTESSKSDSGTKAESDSKSASDKSSSNGSSSSSGKSESSSGSGAAKPKKDSKVA